jgi:class 3 adenylate cyclase
VPSLHPPSGCYSQWSECSKLLLPLLMSYSLDIAMLAHFMGHPDEKFSRELRLFMEEICCNICRFQHAGADNVITPENVRVRQEVYLGKSDTFADIQVQVNGRAQYFIEVKYGYSQSRIVSSLIRKYGPGTDLGYATKVIVVLDHEGQAVWPAIAAEVQPHLREVELELWVETTLLAKLHELFGVNVDSFSEENVIEMRSAIDQAKGQYAFKKDWTGDQVQHSLIWHFGFWRLRQLVDSGLTARTLLPPKIYPHVAVVMADLCGFSGYVRDTRDDDVIRHCLSTFYSKSRYEILNTGGMMYQFVGDEVIGLFGLPDQREGYLEAALDCARALLDIGDSVSHEWQRHIDRVQRARGVHIGVAMGDMGVVSLRPFSRAHLGGIGEVINLSSRLLADAGPGEIVASNTYYQALAPTYQNRFRECEPVEAKNMGTFQAWKMTR